MFQEYTKLYTKQPHFGLVPLIESALQGNFKTILGTFGALMASNERVDDQTAEEYGILEQETAEKAQGATETKGDDADPEDKHASKATPVTVDDITIEDSAVDGVEETKDSDKASGVDSATKPAGFVNGRTKIMAFVNGECGLDNLPSMIHVESDHCVRLHELGIDKSLWVVVLRLTECSPID